MEKEITNLFGLLGRNINYSFSRGHFAKKFEKENLSGYQYINFDIATIEEFPAVLKTKNLKGLNVTIPYKEEVIPYLDELSETAKAIGAVNVIKVLESGKTIGYNSDYYGFKKSLEPLLKEHHNKALILGTGGASKGVAYALEELGITYQFVSRTATKDQLSYEQLTKEIIKDYTIIINCSPLGTSPNTEQFPAIPYEGITADHIGYDLIYNPEKTVFLEQFENQGATIKNGGDMLILQAEKSWEIWNN